MKDSFLYRFGILVCFLTGSATAIASACLNVGSRLQLVLAETETEREAVWRQLPADWQKAYRRVAARVSNPVAEVVRGQCQACHVGATSSGMQLLRRGSLVLCENCGRLQVAT